MDDIPFINADRAAELEFATRDLAEDLERRADHLFRFVPLASTDGRADAWWTLADRMQHVVDLLDDLSTDIAKQNTKEAA